MVKTLDLVPSGPVSLLGEVLVIHISWENHGLWEVLWFTELNSEIPRRKGFNHDYWYMIMT